MQVASSTLPAHFACFSHGWFNGKIQRISGVIQRGATNPITVVFHIDTTICVCRNIYKNWAGQKRNYCDKLYLMKPLSELLVSGNSVDVAKSLVFRAELSS